MLPKWVNQDDVGALISVHMLTGFPLLFLILAVLLLIVIACALWRWHPFLVLLGAAIVTGLGAGFTAETTLTTILQGSGSVFAGIGFIIALGTILGEVLEKTGAIQSIARFISRKLGTGHHLPATSLMGFITGIPVFCDSGFVILSGLVRSFSQRLGKSSAAAALALATGLYTSHVLIPPTPGPLAAAGTLGMADDIGWILLLGIPVSMPALAVGLFFAKRAGTAAFEAVAVDVSDHHQPQHCPPLFYSLVPLLLPVVLIALGSIAPWVIHRPFPLSIVRFLCHPTMALSSGVLAALLLSGFTRRKEWNGWIQNALTQAGPIIFITAAGGALGAVLKATTLADDFRSLLSGGGLSITVLLPVSFLLAAGLKTAQGSSTASLIITASIVAPLLASLPVVHVAEKAALVLSIGAGAMAVSHANDSYFWVVSHYGKLPVGTMYRSFTLATFFMGLTVLACCLVLAAVF